MNTNACGVFEEYTAPKILLSIPNKIGKNGILLGIPNKIKDDNILKYVNNNISTYPFDEERRLFYVALTRTKGDVYLLVDKKHPSKFVLELIKDNKKYIDYI